MREGTIFQLAVKPRDLPAGLRLRNIEWGVFFGIDGTTPLGQIRRVFSLEEAAAAEVCQVLLEKGLIKEREVSLTEYMAAQTAASGKQSVTLLELLQGGTGIRALNADVPKSGTSASGATTAVQAAATPATNNNAVMTAKISNAVPPPVPLEAFETPSLSQPAKSSTMGPTGDGQLTALLSDGGTASDEGSNDAHFPNTPDSALALTPRMQTPVVPFKSANNTFISRSPRPSGGAVAEAPLEHVAINGTITPMEMTHPVPPIMDFAPMEASPVPRKRLSLKNVIGFIISRGKDVNAGQLDVYRVFIRVNTRLLKRNGIHTLRFEEDRLITDPELQSAITSSMERTLGIPCPPELYV